MQLPLYKTSLTDLSMLTQRWKSILDPLLSAPLANGNLLSNIVLKAGDNVVSHKLGAKLQGYIPVLNSAAATFYDKQSSNQTPEITLIINASIPTTVTLYVF